MISKDFFISSLLNFYHRRLSPLYHSVGRSIFGNYFACRFTPTCSVYAEQAFRRYGIIQGTKLTVLRLIRCHPFSRGGFDPLPDKIK